MTTHSATGRTRRSLKLLMAVASLASLGSVGMLGLNSAAQRALLSDPASVVGRSGAELRPAAAPTFIRKALIPVEAPADVTLPVKAEGAPVRTTAAQAALTVIAPPVISISTQANVLFSPLLATHPRGVSKARKLHKPQSEMSAVWAGGTITDLIDASSGKGKGSDPHSNTAKQRE